MKHVAIPLFVVLIFLSMGLYLVAFQVRETESVFVTRFGKPVRENTEPGLYFKWPTPIERVHRFDSRMRVFEAELAETTTKGAQPIIINTFVVWRIAEPLQFLNAVGNVEAAESKLRSQINDTQNRVIGRHSFGEFVNSDPAKVRFEEIQAEMLADLKGPVRDEYGIDIRTLGIKQLKVSEDVSEKVFERMRAARNLRTESIISEGEAQVIRIKSDANSKRTILLAAAEGRAKVIKGQGDAEAAEYYKMLEEEPELAIFLRNNEALRNILSDRTTIVIPADSEPFTLLKEIPALGQKK